MKTAERMANSIYAARREYDLSSPPKRLVQTTSFARAMHLVRR